MGILLVLAAVVLFIIADFAIRAFLRKSKENKLRKEREQLLNEKMDLDFSMESASLKRVEVENPAARILAVDDEEIILDSFRKILVIDGYSVDTVQTGQEALGLIQKNNYDFVFTDLKMPEMSGVDVCKGVKQLRPDMDVIIITGYASVETAVETLKYGAMDYVQKPFTEDELLSLVKKFVLRRAENLARQNKVKVNIINQPQTGAEKNADFSIPGGVFIAKNHCWASLDNEGSVYVGLDDFANKIIGPADEIVFPEPGANIEKYQPLFTVKQANNRFIFDSPLSGRITAVNTVLAKHPHMLQESSYFDNWICRIEPEQVEDCFNGMEIGQKAVAVFDADIEKLKTFEQTLPSKNINKLTSEESKKVSDLFFKL